MIRVYYVVTRRNGMIVMNMAGYDRKALEVRLADWLINDAPGLIRKDLAIKSGLVADRYHPPVEIHIPGAPAPRFD